MPDPETVLDEIQSGVEHGMEVLLMERVRHSERYREEDAFVLYLAFNDGDELEVVVRRPDA